MSLDIQFLTMGLMLASGVLIGILFDLYRVLAHELRFSRWLIPLLDLAYWAAVTVLIFRVLYYGNFGQVRLFVFLGLFTGYTLYFLVLSQTTMRVIRWLIRVVEAIIHFVVRVFQICVIQPILIIYKLIMIILRISAKFAIFIFKFVVQLLYPVRFLVRLIGRALRPYWKVPDWVIKPWHWFLRWLKR